MKENIEDKSEIGSESDEDSDATVIEEDSYHDHTDAKHEMENLLPDNGSLETPNHDAELAGTIVSNNTCNDNHYQRIESLEAVLTDLQGKYHNLCEDHVKLKKTYFKDTNALKTTISLLTMDKCTGGRGSMGKRNKSKQVNKKRGHCKKTKEIQKKR